MDDLATGAENTWCPGCGNFGIMAALTRTVGMLEKRGIPRQNLVLTAGIGCHGKIFDYIGLSGVYSLHGRSVATVQGIKLANPALMVVAFCGDGDAYGEGLEHLIFAAKRNADIAVIVHNNGVYALTVGQYSPTTEKGYKGPSTPQGSVEEPLNPLSLLMEAGATFVARGYAGKIDHLAGLIVQAVEHRGFSIVDVLQPSVVFNNTYQEYNRRTEVLAATPETYDAAMKLARDKGDKIPIGVFLQKDRPVFHRALMGDRNPAVDRPSRAEKARRVQDILDES